MSSLFISSMNLQIDLKKVATLTVENVFTYFNVTSNGLSQEEALKRESIYGKNKIPKGHKASLFYLFFKQISHFMAILLWIAAVLAWVAKMPELAIATCCVVIINGLFSFFQEYKADKALSELGNLLPNKINIYRDGKCFSINVEDITIGDLIRLETGNSIPADARIIHSEGLSLDNSLLTGESVPVDRTEKPDDISNKNITECQNFIFAGTTVTTGKGLAIVFALGKDTQIGEISQLTQNIKRGESNLEIQVQKIVKFITKIALVLGVASFCLAIYGGMSYKWGAIFALGMLVANIPEGLLPTVSLSLAMGVQRMAKRNALIRKLSAVETLSSVSVICTDKTGTITENQLTVNRIWTLDSNVLVGGLGLEKEGKIEISNLKSSSVDKLMITSILCSDTDLITNEQNPGLWKIVGNSTEGALLIASQKGGFHLEDERKKFERLKVTPFSSDKKMMSVEVKNISNNFFKPEDKIIFIKGAPLEVLAQSQYSILNDNIISLDDNLKDKIIQQNNNLSDEGFRVLALAYTYNQQTIFLGLAAMVDPLRPEVKEAFKQCERAGIKITIITGDYGMTAAAIAKQLGLSISHNQIISGNELEQMTDNILEETLKQYKSLIFARSTPIHKLRIIEAYKRIGETVAVTGDGVNDSLALRSSHIGIAMGLGGTDVAREAADMVLLDNNFATIIKAIEEGRAIYSNIRKFLTYILASNVPEFTPFVTMVLGKIPPSLNILQILAIDLGTDMLPAMALGAEKPEKGILDNPPSKYKENLLNKNLFWKSYGFLGLIEGILSGAIFLYVWFRAGYSWHDIQVVTPAILDKTASPEITYFFMYATTMTFASIIACQVGNLFICRSERNSFLSSFTNKNNLIYIGLFSELVITCIFISVPFIADLFEMKPIHLNDIWLLLICPVIMILLDEIRKMIGNFFVKMKTAY